MSINGSEIDKQPKLRVLDRLRNRLRRSELSTAILPGSDIPEVAATSSIGAVEWPPASASEQRKKGIYPSVVENQATLDTVLGDFQQFPFSDDVTRYMARVFVSKDTLRSISPETREQMQNYLEGMVDLGGSGVYGLSDCMMIYLGKNHPSRMPAKETLKAELETAANIFDRSKDVSIRDRDLSKFTFKEITQADRQNPELLRQYAELYSAFGWDTDAVQELLNNPSNALVACFEGDELVSAGMAERGVLHIQRQGNTYDLVMYEVTEAATKEEYRGRGLYTKIAQEILRQLAKDADLVYAESNTAAPGVMRSARQQGRRSTLEDLEAWGFKPNLLLQSVRISGGSTDNRPASARNDLLVTYMTRNTLRQLYGSQERRTA